MATTSLIRLCTRASSPAFSSFRATTSRPSTPCLLSRGPITSSSLLNGRVAAFSTSPVARNDHGEETFEEFTARYEKEFEGVQDVFELQRNLNNAFAYDLVPSTSVCIAALRAARRVHDYPTAVRVFEGIKAKVENRGQYQEYLKELKDIRDELGIDLKEDLYPEQA